MKRQEKTILEIQKDLSELARLLGLLGDRYREEPLMDDAQKTFLRLTVNMGKVLNIQVQ